MVMSRSERGSEMKSVKQGLRTLLQFPPIKVIRVLLHFVKMTTGYVVYVVFDKTPAFAYQSMIALFCLTRGRSSDFVSHLIGAVNRPYDFPDAKGILGNMSETAQRQSVIADLKERGYHVFEKRLPDDLCDQLLQYATTYQCSMRPMDGATSGERVSTVYHRGAPQAVRYDFATQDLLENKDIQQVISDMSFAAVAQDYLGARPLIDVLAMWWHTAYSDKPDMMAAQYYHFDMDRPKWLKFFIYLTDVNANNGPHTFIAGSHKTGGIPDSMLQKGYARLTDEEVESHYGKSAVVEFAAPRGTIIAEDTRGLHKGKHVADGDRLILQVQFSNTLFGGDYPKARMGAELSDKLKIAVKKYPDLYIAYL